MVNSSGEIQSIFVFLFFFLFYLPPHALMMQSNGECSIRNRFLRENKENNARSYIFHVMTCSVFMRRTIQWKRKKKSKKTTD